MVQFSSVVFRTFCLVEVYNNIMAQKTMPMPELNSYMDKKVQVKLKGGRSVVGELRGVDTHMNLVLHNAVDDSRRPGQESLTSVPIGETVIRGNVVVEIVGLTA